MKLRTIAFAAIFAVTGATAGHAADCGIENDTELKMLSNSFAAWKAVADTMSSCGNFQADLDTEFREKQPAAMAAKPAVYQIGGVSNATIVPLLEGNSVRTLDDLVAAHGQNLKPNQLIKIDGQTMAIAFMVNAQHLMYRRDIFDELGLSVPETYDEVLEAAQKIQDSGKVRFPLGGTYEAGWNVGEEFINMYLGFGGTFLDADNQPTVNSEAGVKALNMMKALTEFMDPEFLTADSTFVAGQFQRGEIAMANLWASRAGNVNDPAESQVAGKIAMAAAPLAEPGARPASTLWWDGFVFAKNMTDEQAEAAFLVALEGINESTIQANNDEAVWLANGYTPTPAAVGAIATAEAGAVPYPASTPMGLMHTALGDNIADFLSGNESAEQALADVEAAYQTAAREAGLL